MGKTQEDEEQRARLEEELSDRMGQALQAHAERHGLSYEQVRQRAIELLEGKRRDRS